MKRSNRAAWLLMLLSACIVGCASNHSASQSTKPEQKVDLSAPVERLKVVVTSYVPMCVVWMGSMPGLEERFDCLRCEILEPVTLEGRRITFRIPNDYAHPTDFGLKALDVVEIELAGRSVTTDYLLEQIENGSDAFALEIAREKIKAAEPDRQPR